MTPIKSPWEATFDQFAGSIQESAIVAAPCITREPIERLAEGINSRRRSVRLNVLTNLHPENSAGTSLDIGALIWLCEQVPDTTVRHLRRLHAKVYVADDHTAIVTSANLTNGGLSRNRELGVAITDPETVKDIAEDLWEYGNLGILVPPDELIELGDMAKEARRAQAAVAEAAPDRVKSDYNTIVNRMDKRLIALRIAGEEFDIDPEAAITAQFADAIKYILRSGPMRTVDMYSLVEELKPELCSNDTDIIINDENFGKDWQRTLRNAQQQLRRNRIIIHEGGRNGIWRLRKTDSGIP